MVNPRKILTLTAFLNRTFAGEIAKNRGFCGGIKLQRATLYHAGIYHGSALRNSSAPQRASNCGPPVALMFIVNACGRVKHFPAHERESTPDRAATLLQIERLE
jgi:hypothetical protein